MNRASHFAASIQTQPGGTSRQPGSPTWLKAGWAVPPTTLTPSTCIRIPTRAPVEELWPDLDPAQEARRREYQERVSKENGAYASLGRDACGRYELAGKSIAVPFVGATAATFVIAEVLRLLHRGPAIPGVKLRMASLEGRVAQSSGNYSIQDFAGLKYCTTS